MKIDDGILSASDRECGLKSAEPASQPPARLTPKQLWDAIEALARRQQWSVSRLATRAGLDPTALNRSKRRGNDGKARWPSTETLAKLLNATQTSLFQFSTLVASADGPGDQAQGSSRNCRGYVLLVDDEAMFREALAASLRSEGFTVYVARDHHEALDLLDGEWPVEILCTEIVMPDSLGGVALGRLALRRRPGIKILYLSGYDLPRLADANGAFLRKSVGQTRLVAEIERILEENPNTR